MNSLIKEHCRAQYGHVPKRCRLNVAYGFGSVMVCLIIRSIDSLFRNSSPGSIIRSKV